MGLSLNQALNTASMGMQAAESSINVIGNNLSNANTIGFKSNRADFEDMFSRTYTYGSAPGSYNGGTNPKQIGLGVTMSGVSTDFSQGTVKGGMTPTDMAIEGNGFFVLQPNPDDATSRYYSRNGVMKRNSNGDLVNSDGLYVMGYTVNDNFELQTDKLSKISIPLGEMKIAEATENVVLDGLLNATGNDATQGTVLSTGPLTDLSKSSPGGQSPDTSLVPKPDVLSPGTELTATDAGGDIAEGNYKYRFVYVDANGVESNYSEPLDITVEAGQNAVLLTELPTALEGYSKLRIYRADAPAAPNDPGIFYKIADLDLSQNPTEYTDAANSESITDPENELEQARLTGKYSYYVTYVDADENESRPSYISNPQSVSGGQIELSNLPTADLDNNPDGWVSRKIYRCTSDDPNVFYELVTIGNMNPDATYIDKTSDDDLRQNSELSFSGKGNVLANDNTKLVDIGQHLDDGRYVPMFETGTLNLIGNKGGNDLAVQTMEITNSTTVADYLKFLNESFGIRSSEMDGIKKDQGDLGKNINGGTPGAAMVHGAITILGNSGTKNEIRIDQKNLFIQTESGKKIVDMPFTQEQLANGESIHMSLEVYDSLGAPVNVSMRFVLESKTDTETIYRWYADSGDNHPLVGNETGIGTGTIRFASDGAFIDGSNTTISVQRMDEASQSPMSFSFGVDMSAIAALATNTPEMTMISQDGAGAGILTKFSVGDDGVITGTFSSNVTRPIGQILLATFVNDEGLAKKGDNLFQESLASGGARIETPASGTAGKIKGNSVELSNTDIGRELIDMILASTMYQANAKIVTTSNVMMDALLRAVG